MRVKNNLSKDNWWIPKRKWIRKKNHRTPKKYLNNYFRINFKNFVVNVKRKNKSKYIYYIIMSNNFLSSM